jgi:PIN domain nuclease of toxin-antitoxin system
MHLLLDTHLLLWALAEPHRLDSRTTYALEDHDNQVFFSAASIWEISIKSAQGRADFAVNPSRILQRARAIGFIELVISGDAALLVADLPVHHRDPFDRLLIAQAIHKPLRLFTADPKLPRYSELVTLVGRR